MIMHIVHPQSFAVYELSKDPLDEEVQKKKAPSEGGSLNTPPDSPESCTQNRPEGSGGSETPPIRVPFNTPTMKST